MSLCVNIVSCDSPNLSPIVVSSPLSSLPRGRTSADVMTVGWLAIRDDVVACMEKIRNDRLRGGWRVVLSARLRTLRSVVSAIRTAPPMRTVADEYKPGVQDLAIMPEVRELLEAPDDDEELDEQELADALIPMLPDLERKWQRARRREYRALLAGHRGRGGGRARARRGGLPVQALQAARAVPRHARPRLQGDPVHVREPGVLP